MISIPSVKIKKIWKISTYGTSAKFIKEICKHLTAYCLESEKKMKNNPAEISINFCTKNEIQQYNSELMNKNKPTDVLTSRLKNNHQDLQGSIFLCLEIIKEDAQYQNKEYLKHLAHLIIHGTLHLIGYKHYSKEEKQSMEAKEIILLSKLGIKNPYLN